MATFTENYNLIKPSEEDYYDVQDFNENMDTIDAQMMETEQELGGISEKIGAASDTEGETIFAHLNRIESAMAQGNSVIKSIQRVVFDSTVSSPSSINIQTVDPSKCIVLYERMHDYTEIAASKFVYTLNANSLSLTHSASKTYPLIVGFWIVEFY